MTTLKAYSADEIAKGLAERLGDKNFTELYKKADVRVVDMPTAWWNKGPTAKAFKDAVDRSKTAEEIDAIQNDYLGGGPKTTALAKEGIDDVTELRNYADKVAGSKTQAAADGSQAVSDSGCPEHAEAQDGCAACDAADGTVAVAIDFAIRHMVKVADALDKTGFTGVAGLIDETLQKLASQRPIISEASRSYKSWVSLLKKKSPKAAKRFSETYKNALKEAKKEKKLDGAKAEEYAMRVALDNVPKSYLKEPTPEHGKGKSGPLTKAKKK